MTEYKETNLNESYRSEISITFMKILLEYLLYSIHCNHHIMYRIYSMATNAVITIKGETILN